MTERCGEVHSSFKCQCENASGHEEPYHCGLVGKNRIWWVNSKISIPVEELKRRASRKTEVSEMD